MTPRFLGQCLLPDSGGTTFHGLLSAVQEESLGCCPLDAKQPARLSPRPSPRLLSIKRPEPKCVFQPSHSQSPRTAFSLIPCLPGQILQGPRDCATVPSPRQTSLILQLVDASSESPKLSGSPQFHLRELTRHPLFLAHLPPGEPDPNVGMDILLGLLPACYHSAPLLQHQHHGGLSRALGLSPDSNVAGWMTLSKTGLNLPMCKMGVRVWAGVGVGPVVFGGCFSSTLSQPRASSPQSPAWAPNGPQLFPNLK